MSQGLNSSGKLIPEQTNSRQPPRLSSYRFVCFIVYLLLSTINQFAPLTFVAVPIEVSRIYDQSTFNLNLVSLCYPLCHSFTVFPANYLLDQKGLKTGLTIGSVFMISGYLIRLLINRAFWTFILGTFVTSFGYIIVLNGITKFTNIWFGVNETVIVNSILIFAQLASSAIAMFLSVIFIDKDSTRESIYSYLLVLTGIAIGVHLLSLIFIRGKPPTPANYSSQTSKEEYWQSIRQLARNKNYVSIFMSIMMVWGCLSSFFVTLQWQLQPYGYDSSNVGAIILISNGTGFVGSIVSGLYVQNTKKYKFTVVLSLTSTIVCVGLFWLSLQLGNGVGLLYTSCGLMGFFLFPFYATLMDLSNEVAFPIGESTSSGFLLCGGQLFGFVLGMLTTLLFKQESLISTRVGNAIYVLLFVLGLFFLSFLKQDLKRTDYQKLKSEQNSLLVGQSGD